MRYNRIPKAGFVYLMALGSQGIYKIGRSKSPRARAQTIDGFMPDEVRLVHVIPTDDMVWAERHLHTLYAEHRQGGEWFALTEREVEQFGQMTELRVSGGALPHERRAEWASAKRS